MIIGKLLNISPNNQSLSSKCIYTVYRTSKSGHVFFPKKSKLNRIECRMYFILCANVLTKAFKDVITNCSLSVYLCLRFISHYNCSITKVVAAIR